MITNKNCWIMCGIITTKPLWFLDKCNNSIHNTMMAATADMTKEKWQTLQQMRQLNNNLLLATTTRSTNNQEEGEDGSVVMATNNKFHSGCGSLKPHILDMFPTNHFHYSWIQQQWSQRNNKHWLLNVRKNENDCCNNAIIVLSDASWKKERSNFGNDSRDLRH